MKKLFEEIKDIEKVIVKNKEGKIEVMSRWLYSQPKYSGLDNSIEYNNYFKFKENDEIIKYYCPMSNAIYINDCEIENEEKIYKLFIEFLQKNNSYDYVIQHYIDKDYPEESHISIIFKNDFIY